MPRPIKRVIAKCLTRLELSPELILYPIQNYSFQYDIKKDKMVLYQGASEPLLIDLKIDGVIAENFAPNIFTYSYTTTSPSVVIEATPMDSDSTVEGDGEIPLELGANTIEVVVTSGVINTSLFEFSPEFFRKCFQLNDDSSDDETITYSIDVMRNEPEE